MVKPVYVRSNDRLESDAINQTHDAISPSMSLSPRSIMEAITSRLGSATYTEHVRGKLTVTEDEYSSWSSNLAHAPSFISSPTRFIDDLYPSYTLGSLL
jgi:hypothetical protein